MGSVGGVGGRHYLFWGLAVKRIRLMVLIFSLRSMESQTKGVPLEGRQLTLVRGRKAGHRPGVKPISRKENPDEWDFPGGPVVKNPPSNAGDMGLIPGQGTKISHAVEHLSHNH